MATNLSMHTIRCRNWRAKERKLYNQNGVGFVVAASFSRIRDWLKLLSSRSCVCVCVRAVFVVTSFNVSLNSMAAAANTCDKDLKPSDKKPSTAAATKTPTTSRMKKERSIHSVLSSAFNCGTERKTNARPKVSCLVVVLLFRCFSFVLRLKKSLILAQKVYFSFFLSLPNHFSLENC